MVTLGFEVTRVCAFLVSREAFAKSVPTSPIAYVNSMIHLEWWNHQRTAGERAGFQAMETMFALLVGELRWVYQHARVISVIVLSQ